MIAVTGVSGGSCPGSRRSITAPTLIPTKLPNSIQYTGKRVRPEKSKARTNMLFKLQIMVRKITFAGWTSSPAPSSNPMRFAMSFVIAIYATREATTLRFPVKGRRPCMTRKLSISATSPFCHFRS